VPILLSFALAHWRALHVALELGTHCGLEGLWRDMLRRGQLRQSFVLFTVRLTKCDQVRLYDTEWRKKLLYGGHRQKLNGILIRGENSTFFFDSQRKESSPYNRSQRPRRGSTAILYSFFNVDARWGGWSTSNPSR
jgi:hypothetical protein